MKTLMCAGCAPWWVQPEVDPHLGLAHEVSVAGLQAALAAAQVAGWLWLRIRSWGSGGA